MDTRGKIAVPVGGLGMDSASSKPDWRASVGWNRKASVFSNCLNIHNQNCHLAKTGENDGIKSNIPLVNNGSLKMANGILPTFQLAWAYPCPNQFSETLECTNLLSLASISESKQKACMYNEDINFLFFFCKVVEGTFQNYCSVGKGACALFKKLTFFKYKMK